jgi:WD40 repeat protein
MIMLKRHSKLLLFVFFVGIAVSICFAENKKNVLWLDATAWRLVRQFDVSKTIFCGYEFSSDGRQFVTVDEDRKINIYESTTGKLQESWQTPQEKVFRVNISPDQSRILTTGVNPTFVLWDEKTRKILAKSQQAQMANGERAWDTSVEWSPDGKYLLVIDKLHMNLQLLDAATFKSVVVLEQRRGDDTDSITAAGFSPDGKLIAATNYNGVVRLWDGKTFKLLNILKKHPDRVFGLTFSPNSKYLATWGVRPAFDDTTVVVWDLKSQTFFKNLKHGNEIVGAYFAPDGKYLVTTDKEGDICAWDVKTWHQEKKINRVQFPLDMAVYSKDGKHAITMNVSGDKLYTKLSIWAQKEDAIKSGPPK